MTRTVPVGFDLRALWAVTGFENGHMRRCLVTFSAEIALSGRVVIHAAGRW